MNLALVRYGFGNDSTLGRLYVDGTFECFTCEDERRAVKVPGETCIPEGRYEVTLRTVGGFHSRYQDRFPGIHHGMLWVRDVPEFRFVLFHVGNTEADTAGCILVGESAQITSDGEFWVGSSQRAYRALYPRVAPVLLEDGEVQLTVTTALDDGPDVGSAA